MHRSSTPEQFHYQLAALRGGAVRMQILRLSERIRELEADGMMIVGDWVREGGKKTGTYRYTLMEKPVPPKRVVYDLVMRDGMRVRVAREV